MNTSELQTIYRRRFGDSLEYRRRVWQVLVEDFFQALVDPAGAVLDLGCGYGEFINQIAAREKYGMDLNPDAGEHLAPGVRWLQHDCSQPWPLPDQALDTVFTSNFFEHLPDKPALGRTLEQARRCLKPGGKLIALGPNIKYLGGAYWDFWDHYLPLTEASLCSALEDRGFTIDRCLPRFLPYTMAGRRAAPLRLVRLYLKLPWAWRIFGKQFLVVASGRAASEHRSTTTP